MHDFWGRCVLHDLNYAGVYSYVGEQRTKRVSQPRLTRRITLHWVGAVVMEEESAF